MILIVFKIGTEFKKSPDGLRISEISTVPTIIANKEFHAEEIIEDDEWFYIVLDEQHQNMMYEFQQCFENSVSINAISEVDLSGVNLIFYQFENGSITFQKIMPSKSIVHKSILKWSISERRVKYKAIENGIEIRDELDAYFDGNNRLYFRNFSRIRNIFTGIDDYFRIATDQEITTFREESIVSVNSSFLDFGISNLKMLAILLDDEDIELSSEIFKSKLLTTYTSYSEYSNLDFQVINGQFIINTNKQLKSFLKLALGRLYENPITGNQMEASTSKKLR